MSDIDITPEEAILEIYELARLHPVTPAFTRVAALAEVVHGHLDLRQAWGVELSQELDGVRERALELKRGLTRFLTRFLAERDVRTATLAQLHTELEAARKELPLDQLAELLRLREEVSRLRLQLALVPVKSCFRRRRRR